MTPGFAPGRPYPGPGPDRQGPVSGRSRGAAPAGGGSQARAPGLAGRSGADTAAAHQHPDGARRLPSTSCRASTSQPTTTTTTLNGTADER